MYNIEIGFGFAVELFVIIYSFLCFLLYSPKKEVQIEDIIQTLKVVQARDVAKKLNIKRNIGRNTKSRAKLIQDILQYWKKDNKTVELALNEMLSACAK